MRVTNWIKKNWTDVVWSKVFAGIILAIILGIVTKLFKWINVLISSDAFNRILSNFNNWLSEDSLISNFSLLLIFVFIGSVITISVYNIITKKWIGRTEQFFASDHSFTVRGTYSVNLDLGIQAKNTKDADFWWEQKTNIERSIVPMNGAQFCVVGQTSKVRLPKTELEKLTYSDQAIRADADYSNRIPTSTLIAYKTKNGRYGTMKIKEYGYDLKIEFYTFKLANE